MKKVLIYIFSTITLMATLGCSPVPGSRVDVEVRDAGKNMKIKNFRRLGIQAEVPEGARNFRYQSGKEYVRIYGAEGVWFDVMAIGPAKFPVIYEGGALVWANWNIYSREQDEARRKELREEASGWRYEGIRNRPIKEYGKVVILDTPVVNRFGFRQKIYRINVRDQVTGRVVRAGYIVSVDRSGKPLADDHLLRKSLLSIRFTK